MRPLDGSLIWQILDDGSPFGGDYDGRLGPLTHWVHESELFEGARVLDLGSNAGHFPIEYMRAGAEYVTAVEGRPEFGKQWIALERRIPFVDTSKILWQTADINDFVAMRPHDVLTCLGLVYHMENAWPALKRLATPDIKGILIESQFWSIDGMAVEAESVKNSRTLGLKDREPIKVWTLESLEQTIDKWFGDEWDIYRAEVNGLLSALVKENTIEFSLLPRGLWVLARR